MLLHDSKNLYDRKSYRRPFHNPIMSCCTFSLVLNQDSKLSITTMLDDDLPNELLIRFPRLDPATFVKVNGRRPVIYGLRG